MDTDQATEILTRLVENLARIESQDTMVVLAADPRSLSAAIRLLLSRKEGVAQTVPGAAQRPERAGKRWESLEDFQLVSTYLEGVPIRELADRHQRTLASITARLLRFATVQAIDRPPEALSSTGTDPANAACPEPVIARGQEITDELPATAIAPWMIVCHACEFRRSSRGLFPGIDGKNTEAVLERINNQVCPKCDEPCLSLEQPSFTKSAAFVATQNTNWNYFHKPDCYWMSKVSAQDEIRFGSRQKALDRGFAPCPSCRP